VVPGGADRASPRDPRTGRRAFVESRSRVRARPGRAGAGGGFPGGRFGPECAPLRPATRPRSNAPPAGGGGAAKGASSVTPGHRRFQGSDTATGHPGQPTGPRPSLPAHPGRRPHRPLPAGPHAPDLSHGAARLVSSSLPTFYPSLLPFGFFCFSKFYFFLDAAAPLGSPHPSKARPVSIKGYHHRGRGTHPPPHPHGPRGTCAHPARGVPRSGRLPGCGGPSRRRTGS